MDVQAVPELRFTALDTPQEKFNSRFVTPILISRQLPKCVSVHEPEIWVLPQNLWA